MPKQQQLINQKKESILHYKRCRNSKNHEKMTKSDQIFRFLTNPDHFLTIRDHAVSWLSVFCQRSVVAHSVHTTSFYLFAH